jgi:hypothetical protein
MVAAHHALREMTMMYSQGAFVRLAKPWSAPGRFQQTLKKWRRAQPTQPTTITKLQALLDTFVTEYNQRRPHRSLLHHATPATAYTTRPKATPSADRTGDSHDRVRTDRLDDTGCVTLRVNGRLHHIGIGRTHARTHSRGSGSFRCLETSQRGGCGIRTHDAGHPT